MKTLSVILIALSAVAGLVVAGCSSEKAQHVKPVGADDFVATTAAISSKTSAAAGVIASTAAVLPESKERETIAGQASVIQAMHGPAAKVDVQSAAKVAETGNYAAARSEAQDWRELSVAQSVSVKQLQSVNDAQKAEIAKMRAERDEARKDSINWVFVWGTGICAVAAAAFGALFWLLKDKDWLVLSASFGAGAVVLPFVPRLINSPLFQIPVGIGILGFLGWLGWLIWQAVRAKKAEVKI